MSLAYSVALFVHSHLRWLALALLLATLLRSGNGWRRGSAWSSGDDRLHATCAGVIQLQFLVGLLMYLVLSPLTATFFAHPGASMKVRELRFFGVEHITLMTLAVGLVSTGRGRAKRSPLPRQKHRAAFLSLTAALVLILGGAPWPYLHVQRPLVRGFGPGPALGESTSCPPTYDSRCASCHGPLGRADGPLAASLNPAPREFTDPSWQDSRTDEQILEIIRDGGAASGMSPLMPMHSDLTPDELRALTTCVRSLGGRGRKPDVEGAQP